MGAEVMERKKCGRLKGLFNVSCLSVSVVHSTTCGGATYSTHAGHACKIYSLRSRRLLGRDDISTAVVQVALPRSVIVSVSLKADQLKPLGDLGGLHVVMT